MVTIIVPIYNGERYLRDALESVLRQSYPSWRCLCINDGGCDSSIDIIRAFVFKDNRFVLVDKDNEGVAATRNYGLEHANSEYVAFLDQDDALHPDFLRATVSVIERTNADVVSTNINTIYDDSIKYGPFHEDIKIREEKNVFPEWIKSLKTKGFSNVNVWGKLYRVQAISGIRFPNGVFGADDFVFTLRVMLATSKWAYAEAPPLYIYRMNAENITSRMPAKYVYGVLESSILAYADLVGCSTVTKSQLSSYQKCESKRILAWAIKKSVRNNYSMEEIEKARILLQETRRTGALRFYSIRDRLKYELFVRGHMGALVRLFPKLKAKKV